MPEEKLMNREIIPATPSAEGSAEEELLSTAEASKIAGVSARTLKRRADLGSLRRSSVHTQFGTETRYYKKEIEEFKQKMLKKSAEVVAEVNAELKGRRADDADPHFAGGDKQERSVAELAEVTRVVDQKITKIIEPFFKIAGTLETNFDRLLSLQERMIKIETSRDRGKEQEREAFIKAKEQEKRTNQVKLICYLITTITFYGFIGYMAWKIYMGKLFQW